MNRWPIQPQLSPVASSVEAGVQPCFVLKANTLASLKMTHILHMAEDTAGERSTFWPCTTLTCAWPPPKKWGRRPLQWTSSTKTLSIRIFSHQQSKRWSKYKGWVKQRWAHEYPDGCSLQRNLNNIIAFNLPAQSKHQRVSVLIPKSTVFPEHKKPKLYPKALFKRK